jgi:hypothetical protein
MPMETAPKEKELRSAVTETMRAIGQPWYGWADTREDERRHACHNRHIEELATFMEAGDASPTVCGRYRLDGGPAGMADLKQARPSGKRVISREHERQ